MSNRQDSSKKLQGLIAPPTYMPGDYSKASNSFWIFCQMLYPKFFRDDRQYLHDLADTLQALYEHKLINPKTGEPYRNLAISIPPRHGKSFILTLFTQWVLGKNNENRIITVSYNETLAGRFAKTVRDGIDATKIDQKLTIFNDIFPNTHIKEGDAAAQIWSLAGQFFNYLAAGFGGTITGVGCNIGVIDDPIKNHMEAANDRILNEQWAWYTDTFLSRLEEDAIQILVMTRWTTKDLIGRVLAADDSGDWYVINIPACDDESTQQMLCPSLLSFKSYMKKKAKTSPEIFNANYNGKPIDAQGRLYQEFEIYQDVPRDDKGRPAFKEIVSYTDTADTGSDFLCSVVAGIYEGEGWVLDLIFSDEGMETTEPQTSEMLARNEVAFALIESNNGGRGFARNVERLLWEKHKTRKVTVEWFFQGENKVARILVNATFVQKHIYFPADWITRWPAFYEAMISYQRKGRNAHDDAPDAITGLAELIQRGGGKGKGGQFVDVVM